MTWGTQTSEVLAYAVLGEGLRAVDIAEQLGIKKANVHVVMLRLRGAGLVKHGARIEATKRGVQVYERMYFLANPLGTGL